MSKIKDRLIWVLEKHFDGNYTKMARAAGVTDTAIRRYLKEGTNPSYKLLFILVEKYGVDANWLLTGIEKSNEEDIKDKLIALQEKEIARLEKALSVTPPSQENRAKH